MRVLIVNTSEKTGGAAVAANRLVNALNNNGVKAKMLVRKKETDSLTVVGLPQSLRLSWNFLWERWCIFWHLHFSRKHLFEIDIANIGTDITSLPEFQEADVIHLHWINQGMLSLKGIQKILDSGKPVVWTMHDMWELTGICHHSYGCDRYQDACHHCPFLQIRGSNDLSHKVYNKKAKLYADFDIRFVAVSKWLADKASKSALTSNKPVVIIPNSISLSQFVMINRIDARRSLSYNEKYIVIFGAARIDDDIKGLHFLLDALRLLVEQKRYDRHNLRLLLFGGVRDESVLKTIPVPFTYWGYINDCLQLSQLYSAANIVVSSSLYETFGQTLIEAQLCGCVPVAFGNSGQADIIDHQVNGYLADYLSVDSLADGIDWAFHANLQQRDLKTSVVKKYSESVVASKYIQLYQELTQNKL